MQRRFSRIVSPPQAPLYSRERASNSPGCLPPPGWLGRCLAHAIGQAFACRFACRLPVAKFALNFALCPRRSLSDIGGRDLARQLQMPANAEGRQAQLLLFQPEGGRGERACRHRAPAIFAEGSARESAAPRG